MNSPSFETDFKTFVKIFNKFEQKSDKEDKTLDPDLDFSFLSEKKQKRKPHRTIREMNRNRFKMYPSYFGGRNLWLVKPTSYNRGRGIRIFESIAQLLQYLQDYMNGVSEEKVLPKQSIEKGEAQKGDSGGASGENEELNFSNLDLGGTMEVNPGR